VAAHATMAAPDPSQTRNLGTIKFERALAALRVASAAGAWDEALRLSDLSALQAQSPGLSDPIACLVEPVAAYAIARQGDLAGAQARVGRTPPDCYDAVIFRARIAELAGDHAHADHWFRQAVRMAPSIAFAHQRWAEAKLARGDTDGAIAEADVARKLAPRFADPLETLGEALLEKGDAKGAAAKFAQAAKLAPRWGRLHLKWGEALAELARADEARARWRAAAGMDLTAAERARVAALLAG
jgi:tetratricopeptide (TPR) repeat protein